MRCIWVYIGKDGNHKSVLSQQTADMLFPLLLVLSCQYILGGLVGSKLHYDLDRAEEYFEQFIIAHDKEYSGDEHKQQNFEVFKQNLIMINERNDHDPTAVFGINKFADLSLDEFLKHHTGLNSNKDGAKKCEWLNETDIITKDVPDAFDWRSQNVVTPIKDQGDCGSCWAFGVTGNVEGQYALKNKKLMSFSEQQLVDCDVKDDGCDGGSPDTAMRYLMSAGGQQLEDDYPYKAKDNRCIFDKSKVAVKVTGCKVYNIKDEEKVKELLYSTGPLAIGVDAYDLVGYTGGVMSDCRFSNINHEVLLVGYGTDNNTDYWFIKNSWGTDWGEKGFLRVKRGVNSCGILEDFMVTAVVE